MMTRTDIQGAFQTDTSARTPRERDTMLRAIGVPSLDALIDQTIPPASAANAGSTCPRPTPSTAICAG